MKSSAPPFALSATHASTGLPAALTQEQFAELSRQLRLPTPELLTAEQAAAKLGISERTFHELRHEPFMPPPVMLGPRLLRWSNAQLDAAIANMPRKPKEAPEPAQLLRGRIERQKQTGMPA